jgi:hypothetical protein
MPLESAPYRPFGTMVVAIRSVCFAFFILASVGNSAAKTHLLYR